MENENKTSELELNSIPVGTNIYKFPKYAYLSDSENMSALNCYDNIINPSELFVEYESAEEIVSAFEKIFQPRSFGEDLVIWNYGVDELLHNNEIIRFIKYHFYFAIEKLAKPSSILKRCYSIITYKTLNEYVKYPIESEKIVLFKNCHYYINEDICALNPFILPEQIDIDLYRCKYRINASFVNLFQQNSTDVFTDLSIYPQTEIDKFIYRISNGNIYLMERIWQMIGYLITPDTNARVFFVLQGESATGKSVLGKIIARLFNNENISTLNISQLGNNSVIKKLVNKRINISMDLPNETIPPTAVSFLKQMTGGDMEPTLFFWNNYYKMFGHCKFLFATNHPLILKGIDTAFNNRIVCIPFLNSISKAEQDVSLYSKLEREIDYIATKSLYFYRKLVSDNYCFQGEQLEICKPNIINLGSSVDESNTIVTEFAMEECKFGNSKIHTEKLYLAYRLFCMANGYQYIDNPKAFSRIFRKCFDLQVTNGRWRNKNGDNLHGFKGVTLKCLYEKNLHEIDDVYIQYKSESFDNLVDGLDNN